MVNPHCAPIPKLELRFQVNINQTLYNSEKNTTTSKPLHNFLISNSHAHQPIKPSNSWQIKEPQENIEKLRNSKFLTCNLPHFLYMYSSRSEWIYLFASCSSYSSCSCFTPTSILSPTNPHSSHILLLSWRCGNFSSIFFFFLFFYRSLSSYQQNTRTR